MRLPVRNIDVGEMTDTFLVIAVGTVLVIRFQLWLTNYPQLSTGKLHIAHLLWGGLLMMLAIIIMISFISRSKRTSGAVIGGIGFGFFIDELGKFITKDNDYFFQPTAAIIYIIFVLLYFGTRALQNRQGFSSRENLANALEFVKDGAITGMDESTKRRALNLLDKVDRSDPLYAPTRSLLEGVEAEPDRKLPLTKRVALRLESLYKRIIKTGWFPKVVTAVFVFYAVQVAIQIILIILLTGASIAGLNAKELFEAAFDHIGKLSFTSWAVIISTLVSGILILIGVFRLKRSRLEAYRFFDRGLLVSIFITQVFLLAESQFAAVFGLAVDLILLVSVRYMISQEQQITLPTTAPQAAQPTAS